MTAKPRIRLLHVLPALARGGTEELLYNIFSHLDLDRFEIHVLCTHEAGSSWQHQRFSDLGATTHTLGPVDNRFRRVAKLQRALAVYRFLAKNTFPIVHIHHYSGNAIYARLGAILARVPIIMTYDHNIQREVWQDTLVWQVLNPFTYCNVAISEACRRSRVKRCGNQPHKVVTVLDGIDTERFRDLKSQDRERARAGLGLADGTKAIVAIGRLVPWKRFHLFIQAAKCMSERQDVSFILSGHGTVESELRALARKLGVEHKVRFLGWLDDQSDVYRVADVVVVTSDTAEGFGLVSAEAMAAGLPVVAADEPTHREVITSKCGLLVPPDPRNIANGIRRLLDDGELASRLGANGRKRAVEFFDIRRTARELSALYEKAMVERKLQPVARSLE